MKIRYIYYIILLIILIITSFILFSFTRNYDDELQIFVIFHKKIHEELYDIIPDDQLYKNFTFIAANEHIEKIYPTNKKFKIIKEWELPIYDKKFQERIYKDNGVLYHIYINGLHKPYKYIGILQYDMKIRENIVEKINKNKSENIYFPVELHDYNFCIDTISDKKTFNYIIDDYERYFNRKFSKDEDYPLLNSFVVSSQIFDKGMEWINQLYKSVFEKLEESGEKAHVGGYAERTMGLFIGGEQLEYIQLNIEHNHDFKLSNDFEIKPLNI